MLDAFFIITLANEIRREWEQIDRCYVFLVVKVWTGGTEVFTLLELLSCKDWKVKMGQIQSDVATLLNFPIDINWIQIIN